MLMKSMGPVPKKWTERHISFTNRQRILLSKIMMEKVAAERKCKPLTLEKLEYDKNSQNVQLLSGMPMTARVEDKSIGFVNQTFTIKKIDQVAGIIIIKDATQTMDSPITDIQRLFYVAYCITVHKSQGETYNDPYTIHEL